MFQYQLHQKQNRLLDILLYEYFVKKIFYRISFYIAYEIDLDGVFVIVEHYFGFCYKENKKWNKENCESKWKKVRYL